MKTQKMTQVQLKNDAVMMTLVFVLLFSFNFTLAQNITGISANDSEITNIKVDEDYIKVTGVIKDTEGALPGVSVLLKGTTVGTSSNFKGEFTFPGEVNSGDVLVFSYLGYKTEEVTVTNDTSFIEITMVAEDIEIFQSLQTNKPYKSKRRSL